MIWRMGGKETERDNNQRMEMGREREERWRERRGMKKRGVRDSKTAIKKKKT